MAADLPALVQALPAELYNEVYKLTIASFSFPESRWPKTWIDKSYKPPALLHLNRQHRAVFAKYYYGTRRTFYISSVLVVKWTRSLSQCHLKLIKNIKLLDVTTCLCYGSGPFFGYGGLVGRPKFMMNVGGTESEEDKSVLLRDLECISASLGPNVMQVEVEPDVGDEDMTVWMGFSDAMHYVM